MCCIKNSLWETNIFYHILYSETQGMIKTMNKQCFWVFSETLARHSSSTHFASRQSGFTHIFLAISYHCPLAFEKDIPNILKLFEKDIPNILKLSLIEATVSDLILPNLLTPRGHLSLHQPILYK